MLNFPSRDKPLTSRHGTNRRTFALLLAAHGERKDGAMNIGVARLAAALQRRAIAEEVGIGFVKGAPSIAEICASAARGRDRRLPAILVGRLFHANALAGNVERRIASGPAAHHPHAPSAWSRSRAGADPYRQAYGDSTSPRASGCANRRNPPCPRLEQGSGFAHCSRTDHGRGRTAYALPRCAYGSP